MSGRVAVITGGSRGFGLAFAGALGARGAHVVLADIDIDEGRRAAAGLAGAGVAATALACDVTDEAAVAAMVDRIAGAHGGIDILINNAGLHSTEYNQSMGALGMAKLRRLFDVNVMGVVICSLAVRSVMAGRAGAAIVNISSTAADGCPTAYGVTKLAVKGLTATFAREFAGDGIRVNAISPGLIFTDTIRAELSEAVVNQVKAAQILKQDGQVDDIVQAMLYLCSPAAAFVTGETLRVSGGFGLHL